MASRGNVKEGIIVLALLLSGAYVIDYSATIKSKNFNIITKNNTAEDSYVALVNGELKLIQQGDVPEYDIDEMTEKVKQYETKHKHYLDLISRQQLCDTKECYINELVSETNTTKDDKGYQYKDIIIVDELQNYLSEYDKLLIENGKFSDEDMQKLLQDISENEIVINKINELEEDNPYSLKLKTES